MSEHPNARLLRTLFEALGRRDPVVAFSCIAEDAVWRFPGRQGQLAGEHKGHAAIIGFLGKVMALTGRTFHLEPKDILASETRAAFLFRGTGTREGRTLDNPTCLVAEVHDGKIVRFDEFVWDAYSVDAFWA
jgi:ketosteroid isomerase-like protein